MKVEQAKQIATKAIEELAAALNANPSEALRTYLKTVAKFHKYTSRNHSFKIRFVLSKKAGSERSFRPLPCNWT